MLVNRRTAFLGLVTSSVVYALAAHESDDQKPLLPPGHGPPDYGLNNVTKELKKAEIIPTGRSSIVPSHAGLALRQILDDFIPSLNITLSWSADATTKLGNILKPKALQDTPKITIASPSPRICDSLAHGDTTFTIALTDPDAPSREDPRWSEVCHWIATGMKVSHVGLIGHLPHRPDKQPSSADGCEAAFIAEDLEEIMPFKPPGPPKKTGKHRYVAVLLAPASRGDEGRELTKPKERYHWGTGKERHGVRDWAEENGLAVLGANFIYAQHKKQ